MVTRLLRSASQELWAPGRPTDSSLAVVVLTVSRAPTEDSPKTLAEEEATEAGGMRARVAVAEQEEEEPAGTAEAEMTRIALREEDTEEEEEDEGEEVQEAAATEETAVGEDTEVEVEEEDTEEERGATAEGTEAAEGAAATSAVAGMTAGDEAADLLEWEVVTEVATKISVDLETTAPGMNPQVAVEATWMTTLTTTPSSCRASRRK